MRMFTRKILPLAAILVLAAARAPGGTAAMPDDHHNLLAHGSRLAFWYAIVGFSPQDAAELQTQVFVRDTHTKQQWVELAPLSGRAVALADDASRDTESNAVTPDDSDASGQMADAVALMEDGQWALVSDTGDNRSANNIPGRGRILAMCNDADTLWAVGKTLSPTTLPSPATQPSTNPAASPLGFNPALSMAMQAQLLASPRFALFKFQRGQWSEVGPPPPGAALATDADLSMAMLGTLPAVAFQQADHSIAIWQFAPDLTWHPAGVINPDYSGVYFKLLSGADSLMLWAAPDKGPGSLYINGPSWSAPIPLKVTDQNAGSAAAATARAVAVALDRVRLLWLSDDKVYQQVYDMTGTPVSLSAAIQPAEVQPIINLPPWFLVTLVGLVTMATLVALRNQPVAMVRTASGAGLALAPLGLRILSGLIDALPLLAAAMWSSSDMAVRDDAHAQLFVYSVLAGFAVYILHTFLGELFFSASIGKFLTGLSVVDKSGKPPRPRQIIIRNLLRIVEWPIMLIVAWRTPLRQRIGDLLAGTTVVLSNPPTEDEDPPAEK